MNGMAADKLRSICDLADAAFEQAARKVVERARQTGTPVVVWEDDHVIELPPEQVAIGQPRKTPNTRKKGRREQPLMMRIERMTELGFRLSVFGLQKSGVVHHGVLSAERHRSFRVLRVFRGYSSSPEGVS